MRRTNKPSHKSGHKPSKGKSKSNRPPASAGKRLTLPVCEQCGRPAPVSIKTGLCIKCDLE